MRADAAAHQPGRRSGRLRARARREREDAGGVQGRLPGLRGRRLDRPLGRAGAWRARPAAPADVRHQRICVLGQHGVRHVSGPHPGGHRRADAARLRGAEADISAADGVGRVDRHHEPHGAALRHRSRPDPHPRHPRRRRFVPHHRLQDLHLVRRTRPHREHRAFGARPRRRRAGRHQGHLAVRRAEAAGEPGRFARRAERDLLRLHRAQDGHPRQRHLRDELRRRRGLARRRGEPRPRGHVHDDERGAARRRRSGPLPVRSRLPERRGLREGAPSGPRADRREGALAPGRSDHRASRRAPHPAVHQGVQRGRARADPLDRAQGRRRPRLRGRAREARGRRPHEPDDARHQRRHHRRRFRQRRHGAADVRRPWLHRRMGHGAVRPGRPHRHDLRGRERRSGDGPRRPQAAA